MVTDQENTLLTKDDVLVLKEDVLLLKEDVSNFKTEIIKWIIAVGIAEVVLIVLLVKFL
ncbi:MAG: hypothetical protein V5804_17145 [Mucilaginibacter sp.]|uniref:hypothetical protein n=1 Tax=Mucilaginibacter sp. TaxID=1882438 RepID=UPI0034E3A1E4